MKHEGLVVCLFMPFYTSILKPNLSFVYQSTVHSQENNIAAHMCPDFLTQSKLLTINIHLLRNLAAFACQFFYFSPHFFCFMFNVSIGIVCKYTFFGVLEGQNFSQVKKNIKGCTPFKL